MTKKTKHHIDRISIIIENKNSEDAQVKMEVDPAIPEDTDELEMTPNVLLAEEVMTFLNEYYGEEAHLEKEHLH